MDLDDLDLDDFDDDDDDEDLDDLYSAAKPTRKGRRAGKEYRLFNIMKKKAFDYTFMPASTQKIVVIRKAIALPAHYWYWFGLRLHNKTITVGSFLFQVFETLPSSDDPQQFSGSSPFDTISAGVAETAPSLIVTNSSFRGPYAKAQFYISQGSGTPPQPLYAEMSVVLLARAR